MTLICIWHFSVHHLTSINILNVVIELSLAAVGGLEDELDGMLRTVLQEQEKQAVKEPMQAPTTMATAAAAPGAGKSMTTADLSGGRAVPTAYQVRDGFELAPGGNVRNKITGAVVPFKHALALGLVWPITSEKAGGHSEDQAGQVRAVLKMFLLFRIFPLLSLSPSLLYLVIGCEAKS